MHFNAPQGWITMFVKGEKNHAKLRRKLLIFVLIHNVQALRYQMIWPSWSRKAMPEIINKLINTPWLIKEFYGVTNLKIFFHISHSRVIIMVCRVIQEMMEIFAQKQLRVAENTFNHIGSMCYRLGIKAKHDSETSAVHRAYWACDSWPKLDIGKPMPTDDDVQPPQDTEALKQTTVIIAFLHLPSFDRAKQTFMKTHHNMWANAPK